MALRGVSLLLVWLTLTGYGAAAGADDQADYNQRSAARHTGLFQSLDRNRDGTVTRVEAKGDLNFDPVFDDMDINRDGVVTTTELQRYIEQRYGTRGTR